MPIAYSTLGVPGLPLAEAAGLAADHGWDGLELRCATGESVHPDMTVGERRTAVRTLRAHGLTPLALASYVGVAAPGPDAPVTDALRSHLHLAADLGAAAVRVFPRGGDGPRAEADARAARRLAAVAGEAQRLGVRVLVETHDSHRSGRAVAGLLEQASHPALGALWDLMHTHLAGETPAESHAALGPHLGHVQVKDIAGPHDLTPLPLGAGTLPIADCLGLLPPGAWVCWEYEAPWHPAAAPLPPLLAAGAAFLAAAGHAGPARAGNSRS
ncbi:sugar phosphate isomerase/epimerase [Streptomyces sp. FH025]|uniref:sugar phosphate isomerase/epimerase family protein n=1 Tax=Streptomyces sp. FH025 TaxID=2815937 RepID=UPI001A9CFD1C|nr:TIM barrel protein [Streptomyces sp. FH025]MBO1419190.1 sugar phosphate isomerase/epimerase [Streptomyces sp. FH025]